MTTPDVLIVGAGPTGLMLACELVRAKIKFRIVDRIREPSSKSRALVVHVRTLELFQKLGIADTLIARGMKTIRASVWVNKQHAADFAIDDTGIEDTPFRFVLFVSQAETERVLTEFLEREGVTIERGVEVTDVEPTFGAATLKHAPTHSTEAREETVHARFVVGCDGAHSVVRHAGKFAFEGEPYAQDFILADVRLREALDTFTMCFDDRGVFVMLPLAGDVVRIIAMRGDAPASVGDPTLADVQSLADALSPKPLVLHDPVWLARFRLHHRQADHYRRGPLFIAGDAAHIHSPAGGQGMNTGIQDAANLAWKLALVLRGEADERLLDSYEEERHPIGRELLRTTDRMFSMNTTSEAWVRGLRNFTMRYLAKRVLSSRERRAWIFRFIAELKIGYPESSIVCGGARGGPKPGARAPDAELPNGATIFSLTNDATHHLLVFSRDADHARAFANASGRTHSWLRAHAISGTWPASLTERYAPGDAAIYLIRPDGYVGMSAHALEDRHLRDYASKVALRELR